MSVRRDVRKSAEKASIAALVASGKSTGEVARTVGVSVRQVQAATADVVRGFGLMGPSTIDEARKLLAHSSGRAAQRIAELIESDDEQTALKAASTTLDRVGIGAKSTMQLDVRRTSDAELESEALEAARLLLNTE
jgi:transposase-like protein